MEKESHYDDAYMYLSTLKQNLKLNSWKSLFMVKETETDLKKSWLVKTWCILNMHVT